MGKIEFTERQKQVINSQDKNVLVSAAAGSGKTAVLIERILRLVLENKVDIDRFLVTTFTNAAAAQMKDRLDKAVRAAIDEINTKPASERTQEDRENLEFLGRQLRLIPNAEISTFHSFAMNIMRRYFYLTDLEPSFRITDDVQSALMLSDAVNDTFDNRYETDYENFSGFLRRYSKDRNDNALKEQIINTYRSLRSIPNYMDWAQNAAAGMGSENPYLEFGLDEFIIHATVPELDKAAELYEEAAEIVASCGAEKVTAIARGNAEIVRRNAEVLKDAEAGDPAGYLQALDAIGEFVRDNGFTTVKAAADEKDQYAEVRDDFKAVRDSGKDILNDLKTLYFIQPVQEYIEELNGLCRDTAYYISLLIETENRFKAAKSVDSQIDFDDVMHYAIDILENNPGVAAEYRDNFKYIFVDEYQDSNMLQETIINAIAGEDNLFMVGDVKQSIYKFRLAEPELFLDRYDKYKKGLIPKSEKIDLNNNFRSRKNIRDFINAVFTRAMEGYDEDSALHGPSEEVTEGFDSDGHPLAGYPVELHIINKEELDDGLDYSEVEAAAAEARIRECLKQGFRCRDIVVLSRNKYAVADIERYLINSGIPAYGNSEAGYYESLEISVFINLLRVIDNMQQDVPLISVMKSMFFGFAPSELAEIRIAHRDGSFYDAVMAYAEHDESHDERLEAKIADMLEDINRYRDTAATVTLDQLMQTLLYEKGYYDFCSGLPVGHQRISNLRLLVEKAVTFEETSHTGLYGYLRYIDAMEANASDIGEAKTLSEADDVVRVMTVHKSKGLEFPVVILVSAGKQIGGGGKSENYIHKDFGIGLKVVNVEQHWNRKSLLQNVIKEKKKKEELDEEIRILYVALTRAEKKLIVIGSVKNDEALPEETELGSYVEMMYSQARALADNEEILPENRVRVEIVDEMDVTSEERPRTAERAEDLLSKGSTGMPDMDEEVGRRLGFAYPYEAEKDIRSKYSVSQLNSMMKEEPEREFIPHIREEKDVSVLTPAEIGTLLHRLIEHADFSRGVSEGVSYIRELLERLHDNGTLTDQEYDAIKADGPARVSAFFDTETGRRAAEAGEKGALHKEQEFIYRRDVSKVPGIEVQNPAYAIVQGIIDCCFEEEDGLVLVDYKNSRMNGRTGEDLLESYKGQISLYKEALEAATGKPVKEAYLYLFETGEFVYAM